QLSKDWPEQPAGEPLLQILQDWEGGSQPLVGLINGWEEMTGEAPLASSALEALADARAKAFVALADQFGTAADREPALRLGQNWALADIAAHLSHPEERRVASQLARARDWRVTPMSRNMRPLAILHGLAARATRRGENLHELSPSAMFTVLRLGFFGR
ncbi:MAG: hypothetical protein R3E09_19115, partial [Novosphingobium sp.]